MKAYQKRLIGLVMITFAISAFVLFKFEPNNQDEKNGPMISEQKTPLEKIILESFAAGQTNDLSPYLSNEINLSILDEEGDYTPSKTISRLQAFFENEPPKYMVKKHSGVSKHGDGQYLIGVLSTNSGKKYRCHFFMEFQKITSIEIRLEKKLG